MSAIVPRWADRSSRRAATLDQLAAAHLIGEHAPGRFQLHDLLRLYARQRAHAEDTEPDRRAACERLADWYLRHAEAAAAVLYPHLLRLPSRYGTPGAPPPVAAFPGGAAALSWLEAERANLVAVIVYCADNGPGPAASHLADALRGFGDKANEADTLNSLAAVHRDAGRFADALEFATRARKLAVQIGDQRAQADCLITAASVHERNLQYQQAIRQDRKALRLARVTGIRYQQTRAGQGLATARQGLAYHQRMRALPGREPLTET